MRQDSIVPRISTDIGDLEDCARKSISMMSLKK